MYREPQPNKPLGTLIAVALAAILGLCGIGGVAWKGCHTPPPSPPVNPDPPAPVPPEPAPKPAPENKITEPSIETQQLVKPVLDLMSDKDGMPVAQFYLEFQKLVPGAKTTGELAKLHEESSGSYIKLHGLEGRYPGLSDAITNVLLSGLGKKDTTFDQKKAADLFQGIAWACAGGSRFGTDDKILYGDAAHWPLAETEAVKEDNPVAIQQMYEKGFAGAWRSPAAEAQFRTDIEDAGGIASGADAAKEFKLSGAGEGQLCLPYIELLKIYPTALPGPPQERGDCVSHATKNACLLSLCTEVAYGKADEVTGHLEEAPQVSDIAMANGVLSSESIYWYRGYSGDGWSCSAAASVVVRRNGCVLRQAYPDLGLDLTRYSGSLAGKYGRLQPPANFQAVGKQHLIRTATEINSYEDLRDFLANGYGISTCGGESWSNQRDENGYSNRTPKGWAHAMAVIGCDDRPETKEKYGDSLILIQNSWGKWNSGGRTVRGTDFQIPDGSFWARWRDARNRYFVAFSSVNGWPSKDLPDYGKLKWGEYKAFKSSSISLRPNKYAVHEEPQYTLAN